MGQSLVQLRSALLGVALYDNRPTGDNQAMKFVRSWFKSSKTVNGKTTTESRPMTEAEKKKFERRMTKFDKAMEKFDEAMDEFRNM